MISLPIGRFPSLFEEGLQGSAAVYAPSYAWSFLSTTIQKKINDETAFFSGPLFKGEAEIFLLTPLKIMATKIIDAASANKSPQDAIDEMTKIFPSMFQSALSYGIVAEYFVYTEVKEVAKVLSEEMMTNTPLYVAAIDAARRNNDPAEEQGSDSIFSYLNSTLESKFNEKDMAKSLEFAGKMAFFSANSESELSASVSDTYARLIKFARTGKGVALGIAKREALLTDIATVKTAISVCFQAADDTTDQNEKAKAALAGAAMADALLSYLKVQADQDAYFPSVPVQGQVKSWALALKTQALKMAAFWSNVSLSPTSYQISIASLLWDERLEWIRQQGEDLAFLRDTISIVQEVRDRYDAIKSDLYDQLARKMISNMKAFVGADYLLPDTLRPKLETLLSSNNTVTSTEDILSDVTLKLLPTAPIVLPYSERRATQMAQAISGSALAAAVSYVAEARSLLMLNSPFAVDTPFIKTEFADLDPSGPSGTIQDCSPLTFNQPDPLEIVLPKYKMDEGGDNPIWIWKDLINKPRFALPRNLSYAVDSPCLMWPHFSSVPFGDVFSSQFFGQPIPACYTVTRNRSVLPYSIGQYVDLICDSLPDVIKEDFFIHIASVLEAYPLDYQSAFADAFAATLLIYRDNSVIKPSVPAIYGVPTHAFIEAQDKRKTGIKERTIKIGGVTDPDGTDHEYSFILHAVFPTPAPISYVSYTPSKGVAYSVPVFKSIFDAYTLSNKATPTAATMAAYSVKKGDVKWVDAAGFSPFIRPLPHILFSVFDPENMFTMAGSTERNYAFVKVEWRKDPITGDIRMRGTVRAALEVITVTDLSDALNMADPTPDDAPRFTPAEPIISDDENKTTGDRSGERVAPTSIEPETPALQEAAGAKILSTPIPTRSSSTKELADVGQGSITQEFEAIHTDTLSKDATLSSKHTAEEEKDRTKFPLKGQPDVTRSDDSSPSPTSRKVWYKVIVDGEPSLIQIEVGKDDIPEGAVPASEAEIDMWVREKKLNSSNPHAN